MLLFLTLTVVRFAFFQAVFGLSMDPNDSNEDSESVSMSAKVRSPILKFRIELTEKMNFFFVKFIWRKIKFFFMKFDFTEKMGKKIISYIPGDTFDGRFSLKHWSSTVHWWATRITSICGWILSTYLTIACWTSWTRLNSRPEKNLEFVVVCITHF